MIAEKDRLKFNILVDLNIALMKSYTEIAVIKEELIL